MRDVWRQRAGLAMALAIAMVLTAGSGLARAATTAGEVRPLRGGAVAVATDGRERRLAQGDDVLAGDRIDTAPRSFVLIQFEDDTRFALGQNSSMAINDFIYGSPGQEDNIATQVLKGTFRFVSGLISKRRPEAMRVRLGVIATTPRGPASTTCPPWRAP